MSALISSLTLRLLSNVGYRVSQASRILPKYFQGLFDLFDLLLHIFVLATFHNEMTLSVVVTGIAFIKNHICLSVVYGVYVMRAICVGPNTDNGKSLWGAIWLLSRPP